MRSKLLDRLVELRDEMLDVIIQLSWVKAIGNVGEYQVKLSRLVSDIIKEVSGDDRRG